MPGSSALLHSLTRYCATAGRNDLDGEREQFQNSGRELERLCLDHVCGEAEDTKSEQEQHSNDDDQKHAMFTNPLGDSSEVSVVSPPGVGVVTRLSAARPQSDRGV